MRTNEGCMLRGLAAVRRFNLPARLIPELTNAHDSISRETVNVRTPDRHT
jgi:hypothetical protein